MTHVMNKLEREPLVPTRTRRGVAGGAGADGGAAGGIHLRRATNAVVEPAPDLIKRKRNASQESVLIVARAAAGAANKLTMNPSTRNLTMV